MSRRKILLCEDNDMVTSITRYTLESEDFEVETAINTDEIFEKLETSKVDLILLDLNMPRKGGAFVMQEIKKQKETENIPVILFSGAEDLEKISTQLGADGFIHKPYDVKVLIDTVRKFIPLNKKSG